MLHLVFNSLKRKKAKVVQLILAIGKHGLAADRWLCGLGRLLTGRKAKVNGCY